MQILVLGSAAGGGLPQWNCNCPICQRARSRDPKVRFRTQSSLAVRADEGPWFLLNASPDLRQQLNDNPALHPTDGTRHSPIGGVVVTNADVDHIAGLLTLREGQSLSLYATARVHETFDANKIFQALNPEVVSRRKFTLDAPTQLETADRIPSGLVVEAFTVPGKVALYLEDPTAGPDFGSVAEDTIALRVASETGDGYFYYIPGCAALPNELTKRLRKAPLVFFDGTLWRDDEMVTAGTGVKTGKRMGHMSISGEEGSLAAFQTLEVKRKIFVHLNNTNPVLMDDSPERQSVTEKGWEVAYDGMEIQL